MSIIIRHVYAAQMFVLDVPEEIILNASVVEYGCGREGLMRGTDMFLRRGSAIFFSKATMVCSHRRPLLHNVGIDRYPP